VFGRSTSLAFFMLSLHARFSWRQAMRAAASHAHIPGTGGLVAEALAVAGNLVVDGGSGGSRTGQHHLGGRATVGTGAFQRLT